MYTYIHIYIYIYIYITSLRIHRLPRGLQRLPPALTIHIISTVVIIVLTIDTIHSQQYYCIVLTINSVVTINTIDGIIIMNSNIVSTHIDVLIIVFIVVSTHSITISCYYS